MNTVTLDESLVEKVQRLSGNEETAIETLVNQALQEYLERLIDEKLNKEAKAYEQMHSQLFQHYPEQYAAVHEGQLIDHDPDFEAIFIRVQDKFPGIPILIRLVRPEPVLELRGPSPRLEWNGKL